MANPLDLSFSSRESLLAVSKAGIKQCREALEVQFLENPSNVEHIIKTRSQYMDDLLKTAWFYFFTESTQNLTLVAVGGYGREELLPFSDIDLLILTDETSVEQHKNKLEDFVTFLWDTNLEIGHSVRSCKVCVEQASADLSTATNLLESRFICGDKTLYENLFEAINSDDILTSEEFFQAKIEEQTARHIKLKETEYNLEPNVKNSPGGLRDIQTIGWITRRHFDDPQATGVTHNGFLSEEDLDILNSGQHFLFKIRFALHLFSKRKQDRLLFEYQKSIAKCLGYEDDETSLGIEKMMKQYYRWVLALSELNEMFLQLFDETIVQQKSQEKPFRLNDRFMVTNGFIESTHPTLFQEEPSALLEIFLHICRNQDIKAVKASTIRQIRDHRHLIDDKFRSYAKNKNLFLKILQSPRRVASCIELMLRYGILGKFIPAFGQIIGQTQLDLFHIYTVDAHTMMVLKNMRRFTYKQEDEITKKFPLASDIIRPIKDRELLYIACLFHDIAKGRGGDHSVLGATEGYDFCRYLGLSHRNSNLVSWLIKYHLYMSRTAQKHDLTDPEVIRQFALRVGDKRRLDFLFLLTVADINGTNPNLWNSWRASLLRQLYHETNFLFKQGLETIVDKHELILENQQEALTSLQTIDTQALETFWQALGDDYFLKESVDDIIWHANTLIDKPATDKPLVFIRNTQTKDHLGGSQLFVYTKDMPHTFAKVTLCLEQESLSVVGAQVYSSESGYTLDTFLVISENGERLNFDNGFDRQLTHSLSQSLQKMSDEDNEVHRRTPRQLKFFPIQTQTQWMKNTEKGFNILEVTTADRPGLLAIIGKLFIDYDIELISAKITTLGERVEDIFYIKGTNGEIISDEAIAASLQQAIREQLDQQVAKTSQ